MGAKLQPKQENVQQVACRRCSCLKLYILYLKEGKLYLRCDDCNHITFIAGLFLVDGLEDSP